jgi:hypothetical protein
MLFLPHVLNRGAHRLSEDEKNELMRQLNEDLLKLFESPILTLNQVQRAMNYRSVTAVKQAIQRDTLGVEVFVMPNRRGKFVLTKNVAKYLAEKAFKEVNNE